MQTNLQLALPSWKREGGRGESATLRLGFIYVFLAVSLLDRAADSQRMDRKGFEQVGSSRCRAGKGKGGGEVKEKELLDALKKTNDALSRVLMDSNARHEAWIYLLQIENEKILNREYVCSDAFIAAKCPGCIHCT
jgi:hypothetical protein